VIDKHGQEDLMGSAGSATPATAVPTTASVTTSATAASTTSAPPSTIGETPRAASARVAAGIIAAFVRAEQEAARGGTGAVQAVGGMYGGTPPVSGGLAGGTAGIATTLGSAPGTTAPHTGPVRVSARGQYIAAGYSGHGMPRAFACAEIVASMIAADISRRPWMRSSWFPNRYLTIARDAETGL
jgi:hypothetical protein